MVAGPVVDVVGFAPAGWSVAVAELAAAVTGGDRQPLSGGEQALFAAEVQNLCVAVEDDRHDPGGAGVSFDGGDGDRFGVTSMNPTPRR